MNKIYKMEIERKIEREDKENVKNSESKCKKIKFKL